MIVFKPTQGTLTIPVQADHEPHGSWVLRQDDPASDNWTEFPSWYWTKAGDGWVGSNQPERLAYRINRGLCLTAVPWAELARQMGPITLKVVGYMADVVVTEKPLTPQPPLFGPDDSTPSQEEQLLGNAYTRAMEAESPEDFLTIVRALQILKGGRTR